MDFIAAPMAIAQLNKKKFMALLEDWHSHSVYYTEAIAAQLAECGLEVQVSEDKKTLFLEGTPITVAEPEWGEPGISPLSVLWTVYELTVGARPESQMVGRGFWYRDVTEQLREKWGLHRNEA
ncbi:MAG: hypothetical protein HYV04_02835 [Deltaproteobacteria bacterium]|nr:hypothetical protein [Deltaproteobacteria bacterium]